MNTKILLRVAIAYSAAFVMAAAVIAYFTQGIIREPNTVLLKRFVLFGSVILWFASSAALTMALRGFVRKNYLLLYPYLIIAVVCFAAPALVKLTYPMIVRQAERRDLEMYGGRQLRADVANVIAQSEAKTGAARTFGQEITRTELPGNLQKLSARAAYVAVSRTGLVLVTDGEKDWLGGYLITPPGSASAPARSRWIEDGVFYLSTK